LYYQLKTILVAPSWKEEAAMFPTKTKTLTAQGVQLFSGATSMLGGVASVMVRHSSQTEKQFMKLEKLLRRLTRYSSPDLRVNVITYGEAQFWGKPAHVDLEPGIARIVDGYVARAKAA
jgi:hypothetical protein